MAKTTPYHIAKTAKHLLYAKPPCMKGDKHPSDVSLRTARWYVPHKAESRAQCFAHRVVSLYVDTNNTKPEIALSCNTEIWSQRE